MSSVAISGNAAGAGVFTIASPNSASSFTATLPAATTTLVGTDATQTLTNKTLTTPNIDSAQFATVSGTAPLYGCRAWVNFNGTGTVAIRASGNVSSITDNGNGDYTVNFTTAMPDANYSAVSTAGQKSVAWGLVLFANTGAFATSGLRLITQAPNDVAGDTAFICVAIFR